MVSSPVADRIAALRNSLGMSQTALAEVLGTKPSAISKWEAAKNRPNPDVFVRIAKLCDGADKLFFLDQAGLPPEFLEGGQMAPEIFQGAKAMVARSLSSVDRRVGKINRDKNQLPSPQPRWDPELLGVVIEALNKKLGVKTGSLSDREYVEKVVFYYELCHKMKSEDPAMVERFLKTA
jgi:transcriptional regulator with XRE-family HTH domain